MRDEAAARKASGGKRGRVVSAIRVSFLCVGVVLSVPAAEQALKLRLAEAQSVSPTRYQAELKLDPDQQQFSGAIQINLDVQKPLTT